MYKKPKTNQILLKHKKIAKIKLRYSDVVIPVGHISQLRRNCPGIVFLEVTGNPEVVFTIYRPFGA